MRRFALALLLAITSFAIATPAAASTEPFWIGAIDSGALGPEAMELREAWLAWQAGRAELLDANGPYARPGMIVRRSASGVHWSDLPRARTYLPEVERWRPLVAAYFLPDDVPWAMRVMNCESTGDPDAKNTRSTASGLFQHLASQWPNRAASAGWAGSDVFDPEANVAVAAWLFYEDGPRHWVCR